MGKKATLIIPVYNGSKYLDQTFSELREANLNAILARIVFVNDGSTDDTLIRLKSLRDTYTDLEVDIVSYDENQGKGYAIRYALFHIAQTDFVGFTDVELPYGISPIVQAIEKLEKYDMVAGSRKEHGTQRQYSLYRWIGKKLFRLFIPREIRDILDTQCGLKFFRFAVARQLFERIMTYRWIFDIELYLHARKLNYSIGVIPVSLRAKCLESRGGVHFLSDSLYIIRDVIRIRYWNK